METMIKPGDAARRLGIAYMTLWRWMRDGIAPRHIKTPTGRYLFAVADIDAWIVKHATPKRCAQR